MSLSRSPNRHQPLPGELQRELWGWAQTTAILFKGCFGPRRIVLPPMEKDQKEGARGCKPRPQNPSLSHTGRERREAQVLAWRFTCPSNISSTSRESGKGRYRHLCQSFTGCLRPMLKEGIPVCTLIPQTTPKPTWKAHLLAGIEKDRL